MGSRCHAGIPTPDEPTLGNQNRPTCRASGSSSVSMLPQAWWNCLAVSDTVRPGC